ncbi:DUF3108 domain-containing protein [Nitrosophilus labii]|uniref:DUF3108 domain-containing protein n=1 Tax=Nitrosophilus labii TaxID=2706014 RepID=UPI001656E5BA|nr:DUF3108 domain-containing protein [Nitrosophilus labii]
MRALALGFFLIFTLYSQTIEAKYRVTYGILGKVGYSVATFTKNKDRYVIKVKAKATGLAKILSRGREEEYISEGVVQKGILIPKVYKKVRKNASKKSIKVYRFDHEKKRIFVHTKRYKSGKLESKHDEILQYYAKDDILSLYFNLKKYFINGKKHLVFFAVGGNRKDGKVDVYLPEGKELKKLKSLFGNEKGLYMDVVIHQKIFASKEGRLHIVMDEKSGVAKKALLKDVIFFGDIVGKLDKLKIKY